MSKGTFIRGSFSGLLLFATAHSNALAVQITTETGSGADAYVYAAASNSNYGSSTIVAIKADSGGLGNSRKGYLRFDLSSLVGTITSAALELVYTGTNAANAPADPSTYNVFGLNDGHTGESWGESTITWNNAPANNTSSVNGVIGADTEFLGSFDVDMPATIGGLVSFSSSSLLDFLNDDTNNLTTLLITRQQTNFSLEYFAAKENTEFAAPTLDISVSSNPSTIPEPTTLALMGLGLAGIGYRRRQLKKA